MAVALSTVLVSAQTTVAAASTNAAYHSTEGAAPLDTKTEPTLAEEAHAELGDNLKTASNSTVIASTASHDTNVAYGELGNGATGAAPEGEDIAGELPTSDEEQEMETALAKASTQAKVGDDISPDGERCSGLVASRTCANM